MASIDLSSINLINGGLDVQTIVDNLITVAHQPIDRLQQQNQASQNKITAYQTLNTKLLALKTSVDNLLFQGEDVPLSMPSSFADRLSESILALRKATSSNENVVTATAAKGMATGNFTVTVTKLAKFDSFTSNNFASDTDTNTKTGSLVIQKGTDDEVTIPIDDTNNTLQGIKNAINDANAGFTASILNDGSSTPYRLVITSNDSGTANALAITNNLTGGSGAAVSLSETTPADDAALQINGIDITSSSNTVTNAIEGVTFDLKAESGTAVVKVDRDIDSIVAGLQSFVTNYNDAVSYISSQSTYNTTTKSAGILSGDFTLREAQTQIASTLIQSVNLSGCSMNVLSQIGFRLTNNGTLSLDETKLRDELSTNFNDTAHLLLADGQDSEGHSVSLIPRLESQLKNLTDSVDGPILHATDAVQQNIARINDQIAQMEERLVTQRALLITEYSQADYDLRQLTVLESSLNNQMATLSSM
jgi:flagellar hook-associated protein 2